MLPEDLSYGAARSYHLEAARKALYMQRTCLPPPNNVLSAGT